MGEKVHVGGVLVFAPGGVGWAERVSRGEGGEGGGFGVEGF